MKTRQARRNDRAKRTTALLIVFTMFMVVMLTAFASGESTTPPEVSSQAEAPVVENLEGEEPAAGEPIAEEPAAEEPAEEEPEAGEREDEAPVGEEEPPAEEPEETSRPRRTLLPEATLPDETLDEGLEPISWYVMGGQILLYAGRDVNSGVMMALDSSAMVLVLTQDDTWLKIDYEGIVGYILIGTLPAAPEAPADEEPVAEEPVAEEPVADEPVVEEPVAEEPIAEEPAAEKPMAEEPVAEEPVVEEPLGIPLYEILDEQYPDRKITIYAYWGDKDYVEIGDEVRLTAKLEGYEGLVYSLIWQCSTSGESAYSDIPGAEGASHTFIVNESNYYWFWRVAVDVTGVAE